MGGRGASSGRSANGKAYGSQYRTVLQKGNVKFITKISRDSEPIMETMTKGRVYVSVGGEDILSVTYFDRENKRVKAIDLSHRHNGMNEHVHHGYFHNEYDGAKGATKLNDKEKIMVDKIRKIWYNHIGKK